MEACVRQFESLLAKLVIFFLRRLYQSLTRSFSFAYRYPPVFYEWFLESFPEPNAWLAARSAYIRTCAVISMVGYVVGLGDRHGENILYDSTNGDTVHVDLNCLFEKVSLSTLWGPSCDL
jgi:phosphatidylinositol kinase/protein kinase (PI-3  family)